MTWWQKLFSNNQLDPHAPPVDGVIPKGYIKGKVLSLQPHPVLDRLKKEGYFWNEEIGRWQRTWSVGTPTGVEYAIETYCCKWGVHDEKGDRYPEWKCFMLNSEGLVIYSRDDVKE